MQVETTPLEGLSIITLDIYRDDRGFFVERFNTSKFTSLGLPVNFVQDNHSLSKPEVLRGLHAQTTPPQGKLVGAATGKIWDVAVDIRPESPTLGKYFSIELSAENGKLLWIPSGFAHGFCVIGLEPANVFYKTTALFTPNAEFGIAWNDPDLNIPWPITNPLISDKDNKLQSFKTFLSQCDTPIKNRK
jgi:dTDP-4-dehydrorhamnose 3,5-epimerase